MHKPGRTRQSWANKKKKGSGFSLKKTLNSILMVKDWDKKSWIKNLLLLAIAGALFGAIVLLGLFAWYSRDLPDPNQLTLREVPQSTKIYDRTGEQLLFEISGDEKRTLVRLEDIPDHAWQATITAEDRKFFQHGGIDPIGLLRAVIFAGNRGGGSTLTQQLVKNSILTNERTISRKVKEIILAVALERRYTKEEILQLYLNEIPYGSTNYGLESASQAYYQKPVQELTIAEGATLAALPQIPTVYLNNPDRLKGRRDWIINGMEEEGYISVEERDAALAEETPVNIQVSGIQAPHFVFWVKEQLVEEYGERLVEQGGLEVITSLDFEKQQIAEEAVRKNVEANGSNLQFNNQSLVSIDPTNGHVVAMVGSADYFNDDIDGQVNVARSPRQPGSSFKPIVFAAGFEAGYTPNTILWDVNTTFPTGTGPYSPRNFDFDERGPITIRNALQGSLNIPAVKMLYLIGVEQGLNFAERLGYSTFVDRSRFGLAVVLGGGEVTPLDHAAAYSVFASDGVYREPVAILNVKDGQGNLLAEWEDDGGEEVLNPNIARMISNVLSDDGARSYIFGRGSILTLPGRTVAAKSGTTNNNKDGWLAGYTPQLVTVVWGGNTDGSSMSSRAGGSSVSGPAWNEYMRRAHEGMAAQSFNAPAIPTTGKAIIDGTIPSQRIVIDRASGKLATDRTPDSFREEKICGEYSNILTYVNRSNPLGPVPNNPGADPMWDDWENAVLDYIERRNNDDDPETLPLENCEIPTEEDDVHVAANEPNVRIRSPRTGENVQDFINLSIQANAPRGIARIEALIDGRIAGVFTDRNNLRLQIPSWVESGSRTLTIIAYDDVDNRGEDSVRIDVSGTNALSSYQITNPTNGQLIINDGNPYTVVAENANNTDIASLRVVARNQWTGSSFLLYETVNPGPIISFPWSLTEDGTYIIELIAVGTDGSLIPSTPVQVLVRTLQALPDDFNLLSEGRTE